MKKEMAGWLKVPGWDVVECWAERYSLTEGSQEIRHCSSSLQIGTHAEPASPFLGIYPKETIKHELKAIHGSVT